MKYSLLGVYVCREAFLKLTGLGASTVQECRQGALAGKASFVSQAELGMVQAIKNTSRAKAYLDARQWLEIYASKHAEMSPMKLEAYLPGGRKIFYWHEYVHERKQQDLDLHGQRCTPQPHRVENPDRSQAHEKDLDLQGQRCTPQPHRVENPDRTLADYPTFLKAWRQEVPWIILCRSVSMFVRCGVCEYLKLLVEQCPREQDSLRNALKDRLGSHFQFQSAQRLAQGRLEEQCQQSGGAQWFMKIDKMDQKKTVTPTVWSQLATPLFKDLSKRFVTGLIGSMWHGTLRTSHHLRSVFEDCLHGAEMQCSAILCNLHEIAREEGHLPQQFHIGADNTYKETKNQVVLWFLVWLLCVLEPTPLWTVTLQFLLVGHTHDALDRFFSRVVAAISGHDFFTVPQLFELIEEKLQYCRVKSSHLAQSWGWKGLLSLRACPTISQLGRVHAIKLFRSSGIYAQWKQWMTDEAWSTPVLLVSPEDVYFLASFRPEPRVMRFEEDGRPILGWIDRFEQWCVGQPTGKYLHLDEQLAWLRRAAVHQTPGVYAPGATVDEYVCALRTLRGSRPEAVRQQDAETLPADIITQLFPGADIPPLPFHQMVQIRGVTHDAHGHRLKSDAIADGSALVVRVPEGTRAHGRTVPFLVAVAIQTPATYFYDDKVLVAWWLPSTAKTETFRSEPPVEEGFVVWGCVSPEKSCEKGLNE